MNPTPLLVFDTETTGVDVHKDYIVQLSAQVIKPDGSPLKKWNWVLDNGVDIPEEASAIHGISTEMASTHGEDPKKALIEFLRVVQRALEQGIPLVAYNLSFDLTLLDTNYRRYDIDSSFGEKVKRFAHLYDPLVVDRYQDRYRRGSRKLEAVCGHYGIPFNPEEAHEASYDVQKTAELALKMIEYFGPISNQEQAKAHRAWATNFEQFLRRSKPNERVNKDWPLQYLIS